MNANHSTTPFPIELTFKTIDELRRGVMAHATRNGFTAVTKRSNKKKAWMHCKFSDSYRSCRPVDSNRINHVPKTQKAGCPYLLEAKFYRNEKVWKVISENNIHNHLCLCIENQDQGQLNENASDDETISVMEQCMIVNNDSDTEVEAKRYDTTDIMSAKIKSKNSNKTMDAQETSPKATTNLEAFDSYIQKLREQFIQQDANSQQPVLNSVAALCIETDDTQLKSMVREGRCDSVSNHTRDRNGKRKIEDDVVEGKYKNKSKQINFETISLTFI
ncbi:MAG TPA: hypothetical protein VIQ31_07015 [Phormidium sp.]